MGTHTVILSSVGQLVHWGFRLDQVLQASAWGPWTQDFSLSLLLQAAVVIRKAEFLWGYIPFAVFLPVGLPTGG